MTRPVAIITGAGSGIGAAIATHFATHYDLILTHLVGDLGRATPAYLRWG